MVASMILILDNAHVHNTHDIKFYTNSVKNVEAQRKCFVKWVCQVKIEVW